MFMAPTIEQLKGNHGLGPYGAHGNPMRLHGATMWPHGVPKGPHGLPWAFQWAPIGPGPMGPQWPQGLHRQTPDPPP